MIKIILLVLFYFSFPLIIIFMCKKWSPLKKLGSIVLAYGFGLVMGSIGILPQGSDAYKMALQGRAAMPTTEMEALLASGTISQADEYVNTIASTQDMLISVIVPLAFPLLLFSLNIRRWLRFAKDGFISMILALSSVVVIVASGYFIFKDIVPDSWKVAGMLIGVYSGGTPNLVSLKVALGVDPNISQMVVVILSITTLSIIGSLINWINKIEKTFQLGMYFILVFSFTVASMADLGAMFSIGFLGLFGYITYAYFGSLCLHLLLSKIFKINADDFLITTAALVFSPPFVPVVAGALKNKDVIITGITVGIFGYVIGNYLGVGLGYFLKGF